MFPCLNIHKHKYQCYSVDWGFFFVSMVRKREFVWHFSSLIVSVDIIEGNRRQLDYSIIPSEKKKKIQAKLLFIPNAVDFSVISTQGIFLYTHLKQFVVCRSFTVQPCQHLAIKNGICKPSDVCTINTERNLMPCLSIFKCNFEWAITFLAV